MEDDLRKVGVKRWRAKALDREEWASIIREAKAKMKGSYSYRKKKNTVQLLAWDRTRVSEKRS